MDLPAGGLHPETESTPGGGEVCPTRKSSVTHPTGMFYCLIATITIRQYSLEDKYLSDLFLLIFFLETIVRTL